MTTREQKTVLELVPSVSDMPSQSTPSQRTIHACRHIFVVGCAREAAKRRVVLSRPAIPRVPAYSPSLSHPLLPRRYLLLAYKKKVLRIPPAALCTPAPPGGSHRKPDCVFASVVTPKVETPKRLYGSGERVASALSWPRRRVEGQLRSPLTRGAFRWTTVASASRRRKSFCAASTATRGPMLLAQRHRRHI